MQTLRVDERVQCLTVFTKGKLFASMPNQKWVRKKTLCADYNLTPSIIMFKGLLTELIMLFNIVINLL